jgi:hypothetical protein
MITNFQNLTAPNVTPVDGDAVSYEVNGRAIIANWDWNTLMQVLKVSEAGNPITKLEFRRLFPLTAITAIDNFEHNVSLDDAVKVQLRTINASFSIAENINLSDSDVEQALDFYVLIGFMTEAEKETVLTGGHA